MRPRRGLLKLLRYREPRRNRPQSPPGPLRELVNLAIANWSNKLRAWPAAAPYQSPIMSLYLCLCLSLRLSVSLSVCRSLLQSLTLSLHLPLSLTEPQTGSDSPQSSNVTDGRTAVAAATGTRVGVSGSCVGFTVTAKILLGEKFFLTPNTLIFNSNTTFKFWLVFWLVSNYTSAVIIFRT